jgi:hypothetical protein
MKKALAAVTLGSGLGFALVFSILYTGNLLSELAPVCRDFSAQTNPSRNEVVCK